MLKILLLIALLLMPNVAQAAISFIDSAGGNAINAGSITVTLPGGMNANDLILVAYAVGDDDFTQPTLALTTAGYTEITSSTLSSDGGTGGDGNLAVFYKFHNGSDTNVVTTAAGTGTDSSTACQVLVFRGVDTGSPFDATATTATGTSGGDPNPASISFSSSGTWVVAVGAVGNAAAITLGTPTNYTTPRASDVGDDTFDTAVRIAYRSNPTSPEDPPVFTDSGAGVAWAAVTIALKEAPPPPDASGGSKLKKLERMMED